MLIIDDNAPAPRIWFPPASTGSIVEDSEVARNNKTDDDLETPRTINEVCVLLRIFTSGSLSVENLNH